MVKYSLGTSFNCWQCRRASSVNAPMRRHSVEWTCKHCGAVNHVFVDQVRFRVGSQLLLAARDFIHEREFDLAAILLVASVDASLGVGIRELTIWRAIEACEAPPQQQDIDCKLRGWKYKKKKMEFEKLAGATMESEIERLHANAKISTEDLPAYKRLVDDFEKLGEQRNRLLHMGEPVDEAIVQSSASAVARAVFLLEEMYHAAYDLRRPPLHR
jgi:hypothetical protein